MDVLAKIVRVLAWTWMVLAAIAVLLSYGVTWYSDGFWALQERLSPYNLRNYIAVIIIFAPGYTLFKLGEAIERKHWTAALGALIAFPLSLGLLAAVIFLISRAGGRSEHASTKTREYPAASVIIKNNSATMYAHRNYYITIASGPVGKEGIPEKISIGDKVIVKDRSLTANHIFVTEVLQDMEWAGKSLGRKGDITCTIVEKIEDLPYVDENARRNRLWINIAECEPLKHFPFVKPELSESSKGEIISIRLMTPVNWADLSEHERDIYTAATLETWSFLLYSYSGQAALNDISDFAACVKGNKISRFTTALWVFKDVQKSVAEHIFNVTPTICREYAGKGDRSGEPLRILSKSEWSSFDTKRKAIFVVGYLEMVYHAEKMVSSKLEGVSATRKESYKSLERCLAGIGLGGVFAQVYSDERNFEWQYPLPWSVAKSLGKACKSYM